MRTRFTAWLRRNLDVVGFGAALASVGPLLAWWSVLVRRNILRADTLAREQFDALAPAARTAELEKLSAMTERQLFMVTGESALAGVLVVTLAVVLFLIARKRAQENQRLKTMLQLTSHQLKTPIAGVRMLLQSLGAGSIPTELQAKYLAQGVAECDRLEHLVETFLAYQRTVVRRAARAEPVPSDALVGDILTHRRATFPTEQASYAPGPSCLVRCDRDAVHVVLENLLDNARKYGGGRTELSDAVQGGRWRLTVRDFGQGFEPREVERLFAPFERGGGKGTAHGSGLGLYISRQLAREMGGELSAQSDGPGQGARFTLVLPVAPAATPQEVGHG